MTVGTARTKTAREPVARSGAVHRQAPETTPRPAVAVRALTKRFPPRRGLRALLRGRRLASAGSVALQDVSFEVAPGELFGLLGPNGAGKTTLLKVLSTLIQPDAGTATILGADLVRDPAAVRRVLTPVIADERSLNWRLSAFENLLFFGALHGLRGLDLRGSVGDVLAVVGLSGVGEKMVGAFSSGMKQRLLLARALLGRPSVLLLDEPTRSLDPLAAREFRAFLEQTIVGERGCTVLLATHDPEEGLELCHRVGILLEGRLVAQGSPRELKAHTSGPSYSIRTRSPLHPRLQTMRPVRRLSQGTEALEQGWTEVRLAIPGGEAEAVRVLRSLVECGVEVAGFERLEVTLADLLQDLLEQSDA